MAHMPRAFGVRTGSGMRLAPRSSRAIDAEAWDGRMGSRTHGGGAHERGNAGATLL